MAVDNSRPVVTGFYHEPSSSIAYIVQDAATKRAAIIAPVLDYDEASGRVSTTFADKLLEEIKTPACRSTGSSTPTPQPSFFGRTYLKGKLARRWRLASTLSTCKSSG